MKSILKWLMTVLGMVLVPTIPQLVIPLWIMDYSNLHPLQSFSIIQIAGVCYIVIGLVFEIWVVYAFFRWGKGTPAPYNPPTTMVTKGLYRYTRNPMYFGAMLVLLGESICLLSIWMLIFTAFIAIALHLFIVLYEEPQLAKRFGKAYMDYCSRTPRWLPRSPGKVSLP